MSLPPTVQPEEIVWVVLIAFGLVYNIQNLRQALKDLRSYVGNGKGQLVLQAGVREQKILTAVQSGLLVVGIIALFRHPPHDSQIVTRAAIVVIFLLVAAGLDYLSYSTMKFRHDFVEMHHQLAGLGRRGTDAE